MQYQRSRLSWIGVLCMRQRTLPVAAAAACRDDVECDRLRARRFHISAEKVSGAMMMECAATRTAIAEKQMPFA